MTKERAPDAPGLGRRDLFAGALLAGAAVTVATAAAAEETSTVTKEVNLEDLPQANQRVELGQALKAAEQLISAQSATDRRTSILGTVVPIDVGADSLLSPYVSSQLKISPLFVEYLLQTLNDHIKNCTELRQKGQDLEVAAVHAGLATLYDQDVVVTAYKEAQVFANNRSRVLAETLDPSINKSSGKVVGAPATDNYFVQRHQIHTAYIDAKVNDIKRRSDFLSQEGGGSNFGQRFALIKELFAIELSEAYQRARAVSVGLFSVYGINSPVPPPKKSGYLNDLVKWVRLVTYELEKKLLQRSESVITLMLRPLANQRVTALMTEAEYTTARSGGIFKFSIKDTAFSRPYALKNPRLRGVEVAFWGTSKGDLNGWSPAAVELKISEQKIAGADGSVVYQTTPRVILSPVEFMIRREYDRVATEAVHNVNPIAEWELDIGTHTLTGNDLKGDALMSNVFLFLTVTHDA